MNILLCKWENVLPYDMVYRLIMRHLIWKKKWNVMRKKNCTSKLWINITSIKQGSYAWDVTVNVKVIYVVCFAAVFIICSYTCIVICVHLSGNCFFLTMKILYSCFVKHYCNFIFSSNYQFFKFPIILSNKFFMHGRYIYIYIYFFLAQQILSNSATFQMFSGYCFYYKISP